MFDLSFLQILTRIIATIVILSLMGLAVAAFARLLGDKGTRYDGKLTANPFVHIDIFALVSGIASRMAWIRPIAIDPASTRLGRITPVLVAALTLATIFVFGRVMLAVLPWVAAYWPQSSATFVDATIRMTADVAAWTIALNILPLPPLLGGYVIQAIHPRAHAGLVKRHLIISLALMAVIVLGHRSFSSSFLGDLARIFGAR